VRLLLPVSLLLACPKTGPVIIEPQVSEQEFPETAVVADSEDEPPAPSLTGSVVEGVFMDDQLDFYIKVPDKWEAHAGPGDGNLRVAMTEVQTGLRVEVWAFGGIAFEPRPRGDCEWKFRDSGGYRALHLPDPVSISTCVPHQPADPRVFGYLVIRESWTWQLEVHVPSTATLDSLHRGEAVLSTARWGTSRP
jgi:hypothetical protein